MGKYTDKVQGLFKRPSTTFGHIEISPPAPKRKADEKPAPESAPAQEEAAAQTAPDSAEAGQES